MSDEYVIETDLDSIDFDNLYIGGALDEPFYAAFSNYIKEYHSNCAELSRKTGINYDAVRKYRKGERIPSLEHTVALSVALKLFSADSNHLLTAGGHVLRMNIKAHRIYRVFLDRCYNTTLTVDMCNALLRKEKCKLLVKVSISNDDNENCTE